MSGLTFLFRAIIIFTITIAFYSLAVQFIFSYFTQSEDGPQLTLLNFAGPYLLTMVILIFTGLRTLSKKADVSLLISNIRIKMLLAFLLSVLIAWQTWYLVSLYKTRVASGHYTGNAELMPMTVGILATLFVVLSAIKQKKRI